MTTFFQELRRRRVIRVTATYAVIAWLLIQVADVVFPALKLPDWTVILVLGLLILGLPITILLSWAFDLGPEGIERTKSAKKSHPLLLALGTFACLLVFSGVGLWLSWPAPAGWLLDEMGLSGEMTNLKLPDKPSIVILPFSNMSGDPEQEYFADGFIEDLTTDLSSLPYLFVIARNSAFTYKGKAVNVEQVGKELGVRYVVEGSVRKVGDQIRITAQLIDTTSGFNVWGDRYDRKLAEIFNVQAEINEQIIGAVSSKVMAEEYARLQRQPTQNLTAYDLVLRGHANLIGATRGSMQEARELAQQAVELDPDYADAWSMLGVSYLMEIFYSGRGHNEYQGLAEQSLQRAIELDPGRFLAYLRLAVADFVYGRKREALVNARKSVALAPNYFVSHTVLSNALMANGKLLEGLKSMERGLRLNPLANDVQMYGLAWLHYALGKEQKAVDIWEQLRLRSPGFVPVRFELARHYQKIGQPQKAQVLVREILQIDPEYTAAHAGRHMQIGSLSNAEIEKRLELLRQAGLP